MNKQEMVRHGREFGAHDVRTTNVIQPIPVDTTDIVAVGEQKAVQCGVVTRGIARLARMGRVECLGRRSHEEKLEALKMRDELGVGGHAAGGGVGSRLRGVLGRNGSRRESGGGSIASRI